MSDSKIISQRFVKAFDHLYASRIVTNKSALAKEMGRTPQSFNETLKARTNVGLEMLHFFFHNFGLSPRYVFFGEKPMFEHGVAEKRVPYQSSPKTLRPFLKINSIAQLGKLAEQESVQLDLAAINRCDYVIFVESNDVLIEKFGGAHIGIRTVSLKNLNPNDTFLFINKDGNPHISKFNASSKDFITVENGEQILVDDIEQIFSLVSLYPPK